MKMTTTGKQFIDEVEYGVYVWEMPDKRIVGDDQGNYLSVAGMANDINKMNTVRNAVREFGIVEGRPVFLSGHRKVTDEEYEEQKARAAEGLTPDQYDIPSILEDLKFRNDK
jgi:hypothetical protein